jgi:uncharacterized protein YggT (Ycf19 family)
MMLGSMTRHFRGANPGSLYLLVVLLRFVLQLVRANFYNPLCQFAVKATQPLLKPLRRVIPSMFGLDMSSLVLALIVQALLMAFILMLSGYKVDALLHLLMWAMIGITALFLKIFWAMIISVILSWVAPNSHNPGAELVLPDQRAGAGAVPSPGAEPGRPGHLADLRLHRAAAAAKLVIPRGVPDASCCRSDTDAALAGGHATSPAHHMDLILTRDTSPAASPCLPLGPTVFRLTPHFNEQGRCHCLPPDSVGLVTPQMAHFSEPWPWPAAVRCRPTT